MAMSSIRMLVAVWGITYYKAASDESRGTMAERVFAAYKPDRPRLGELSGEIDLHAPDGVAVRYLVGKIGIFGVARVANLESASMVYEWMLGTSLPDRDQHERIVALQTVVRCCDSAMGGDEMRRFISSGVSIGGKSVLHVLAASEDVALAASDVRDRVLGDLMRTSKDARRGHGGPPA